MSTVKAHRQSIRASKARRGPWRVRAALAARLVPVTLLLAGCAAQASSGSSGTATTSRPGPTAPAADRNTARSPSVPTTRSEWSLVVEPDDSMAPLYSLMSSAEHRLDMTMYELADSRTVSVLEMDAARGVRVRVLLDKDYSGGSVNAAAYSELIAHGVEVRWSYSSTIFHQKTITVDGTTSAIMTLNLTSEDYADTRDVAVITTQPSDVAVIETVFDRDWSGSSRPGPGPDAVDLVWSPGATGPLVNLIDSARTSLLVENEEMDDQAIESALESAAGRGVNVEVVMTYSSDWVAAWAQLVNRGVHVRTYSPNASPYIHAKVVVADGTSAFVGSQNFSEASLQDNRELGLISTEPAVVDGVAGTVRMDYAGATPFPAATTSAPTLAGGGAWCRASVTPANDGYAGDADVSVTSNQPNTTATASDSTDHWSDDTNGAGAVVIRLYHTHAGETVTVTVGTASCATTA